MRVGVRGCNHGRILLCARIPAVGTTIISGVRLVDHDSNSYSYNYSYQYIYLVDRFDQVEEREGGRVAP